MDKCNEFQDLILTDYSDGQMNAALKEKVDAHLLQCASCQSFALEVKNTLIVPFEQAPAQAVPDTVWQGIRERIQEQPVYQESFVDRLRAWLNTITLPKLVPALCSMVMVVFVGSMFFFNQQTKQAQDQEQVLYLAAVLTTTGDTGTGSDIGTPIETYFL